MPVALSVLVLTVNPGEGLTDLVGSLDAQSAALTDFEVVLVDAASDDGTVDRLARWSRSRPNVALVAGFREASKTELVGLGLARASGRHVVLLGQDQRLTRQAVELLSAAAAAPDGEETPDLLLGRATSAGVGDGRPPVDEAVGSLDARGGRDPLVAVRRELLLGLADPAAALADPEVAAQHATTVARLGAYACLAVPYAGPDVPTLSLSAPAYGWQGGTLHLEADLTGSPGTDDARAWLLLATADGSTELALPARLEAADNGGVRLRADVDPRTADRGAELPEGMWRLRARLVVGGLDETVPWPSAKTASAVLDGAFFVPHRSSDGQELDVRASRTSVLNTVDPGDATVVESASGTLLTCTFPRLHVVGDAVVPVTLLLGGFRLPARLVCEAGAARLEGYVSGLAGTSTVSVLGGHGKPVRTGLDLTFSGTGQVTLGPTPAAPAKPRATTPPKRRPSGAGAVVQAVRRHVPQGLEPSVRRLAQVGPVRRLYRAVVLR